MSEVKGIEVSSMDFDETVLDLVHVFTCVAPRYASHRFPPLSTHPQVAKFAKTAEELANDDATAASRRSCAIGDDDDRGTNLTQGRRSRARG